MIRATGWTKYNIWEHSTSLRELYARRCMKQEPELTCHIQASELLARRASPGDSLLDVGCGSGYFYHSLLERCPGVEYYGIDSSAKLIEIGRQHLPAFGLAPERLMQMRIEDLDAEVDHITCINVLSNIDNYPRPLERLLLCARKSVLLRESAAAKGSSLYVKDRYLDPDVSLKVHVNTYDAAELLQFIQSYGFRAEQIIDRHTSGKPEMVIDYPHYWTFFAADKPAS